MRTRLIDGSEHLAALVPAPVGHLAGDAHAGRGSVNHVGNLVGGCVPERRQVLTKCAATGTAPHLSAAARACFVTQLTWTRLRRPRAAASRLLTPGAADLNAPWLGSDTWYDDLGVRTAWRPVQTSWTAGSTTPWQNDHAPLSGALSSTLLGMPRYRVTATPGAMHLRAALLTELETAEGVDVVDAPETEAPGDPDDVSIESVTVILSASDREPVQKAVNRARERLAGDETKTEILVEDD